MIIRLRTILFALIGILFVQSCRKEIINLDSSVQLNFSTDTLHFDTVFSTIGSATRSFKIFNSYDETIIVSNIQIAGGEASIFRMNVDGIPGFQISDVEIPPQDSLYVFIEVTIDPNSDALPYIVEDSVLFTTNGNIQKVNLIAWGQNAHFYNGEILCDTTWTNDLPHVIYNSMLVDSLCTLTIEKGCKIYVHGGSTIYVLGTLQVLGSTDSLVTFQGDRLEISFREVPGQWNGISILRNSKNNFIENVEIKNAIDGILVGFQTTNLEIYTGSDARPQLTISKTKIFDCQSNGLLALNAEIDATNCLIYNVGQSNLALVAGGKYNFRHCTIANYSSLFLNHQTASLILSDIYLFNLEFGVIANLEEANFTNCILYGSISEGKELVVSNDGEAPEFNYLFNHCFLRTDLEIDDHFVECTINIDPLFANISERNYCPDSLSLTLNDGTSILDVPVFDDLVGTPRPFGSGPDIGCYETYVE